MLSNKTKQSCNSPGDLQWQIVVECTVLQFHCPLVISLPGLPHKVPKHNLLMSGCTVPEFLFLDRWFCEAVYRRLNCESSGIKQRRMRELSKPRPLPGSRRGRGPTFGTGPSLYPSPSLRFSLFQLFWAYLHYLVLFFLQMSADSNSAHFYKYLICVLKKTDYLSICTLSSSHSASRRQIYRPIFVFPSMHIYLTLLQC